MICYVAFGPRVAAKMLTKPLFGEAVILERVRGKIYDKINWAWKGGLLMWT